MTAARRALAGVWAIGLTACSSSRNPQRPQERRRRIRRTTTAVLVDVVVRDRQGRPVTDLKAEDFELREDGVVQELGSFTRVVARRRHRRQGRAQGAGHDRRSSSTGVWSRRRSSAPAPGAVSRGRPRSSSMPCRPTPCALCQRAALEYVPMSGLCRHAGRRLHHRAAACASLQAYTDDPALVRQAVRRVLPTGTTLKEVQDERLAKLRERRDRWTRSASPASRRARAARRSAGGGAAAIGQTEDAEAAASRARCAMLQAFDTLDRDQRGFGTTGALFVGPAVARRDARAQDARLLLRGPAGVAGAAGAPAVGDRGGQSRERHDLRRRCQRPARGQRHARRAHRDRGGGQGTAAPAGSPSTGHRPAGDAA